MPINETKILGGKALIYQNDYEIWQFRCWISKEKQYIRESLRTRDKAVAVELAEDKYLELAAKVKNNQKIFGLPLEEAIKPFLDFKFKQVGIGDEDTIVIGRYKTIETHLNHLKNYAGPKTKIQNLGRNFLVSYATDDGEIDYVSFRRNQGAAPATIRNEISTINACFRHLYDAGHITLRKLAMPIKTKKVKDLDHDLVRRQTFTPEEYTKFWTALSRTYVGKTETKNLSKEEIYDRQLARHYFLFACNSGMRSGELRKMRYEDVSLEEVKRDGKTYILAKVEVPALNTKTRDYRKFYCVGGQYLRRWASSFANQKEGIIFSRDGETELHNSFFNKHFRRVIALSKIDAERKKVLVPYSCRHYAITNLIINGNARYEDIAFMVGTSINQIQSTYLHLQEDMMRNTALSRYYKTSEGYAVPLIDSLE
ncbi:MAG: site-specific integrase [Marivivens sp.]|uniref:tyrosine-type recombinase/integrase n=1 Tax=Marivivens sp. TaxID=1978374 RepID=UPI0017E5B881|nr:site-specific integrase [Marivivens sp.]NVJ95201.1 site-specific integrase [Marivivens sp.]